MTSLQAISDQIAEHERHVAALLAQAAPLRAAARSDAIAQVHAKIVEFGLSTRELGFRFGGSGRIPKSSAAATAGPYFHPNTHESWSGHGRRPLWVESALATGYSLKSLQRRPT
ncbi:H-NS histone family protein [uncultured Variovorax sp.]|uniref:H-NS histone family protein n=1 Tax=uncultured Variovorax sp. TaxID=114708 RepID=UPI00260A9A68|nr:H-NS histone family protein [uncultured Variovorax sp.]